MKAVILAGGLGTRISEETTVRPKPMVEVEPPREFRRLIVVSHAAMAYSGLSR